MSDTRMDPEALERALVSLENFRIDPHRIQIKEDVDELGRGGYGIVKVATLDGEDATRSKLVAVKELRCSDGDLRERTCTAFRLAHEVKVWAGLDHPNILPLIGFHLHRDMGTAWIVSPYEANGNIVEYLARIMPDVGKRLQLVIDTADGLAYLHSCYPPVIHGDLKAANILIHDDTRAILCDFGLAKALDEVPSGLTSTKSIKGSFRYLSPELIFPEEPVRTTKSDMWAWGCLAAEILTDRIPFHAVKVDANIVHKLFQNEKPSFLDDSPVPSAVRDTVHKCWESEPTERPDVQECVDVLYSCTRIDDTMLDNASDGSDRLERGPTSNVPQGPDWSNLVSSADYASAPGPGGRNNRGHTTDIPTVLSLEVNEVPPELKMNGPGWDAVFASTPPERKLEIVQVQTLRVESIPLCLQFSPDGNSVAAGGSSDGVTLYSVQTGARICSLHSLNNEPARKISFSPDATLLAASSSSIMSSSLGGVHVWDATCALLFHLPPPNDDDTGLTSSNMALFSPDNSLMVYSFGNRVSIYDRLAQVHRPFLLLSEDVLCMAISPDSRHLAIGHKDGSIEIIDMAGGRVVAMLTGHDDWIRAVAFAPDGKSLISGSDDKTVKVWMLTEPRINTGSDFIINAQSSVTEKTLKGHKAWVVSVAFSPDGAWIISGDTFGHIRFWDAATGEAHAVLSAKDFRQFYLDYGEIAVVGPSAMGLGWMVAQRNWGDNTVRIWRCKSSTQV